MSGIQVATGDLSDEQRTLALDFLKRVSLADAAYQAYEHVARILVVRNEASSRADAAKKEAQQPLEAALGRELSQAELDGTIPIGRTLAKHLEIEHRRDERVQAESQRKLKRMAGVRP